MVGKVGALMENDLKRKESCNKFLAKWMGECWHEWNIDRDRWKCKKCGALDWSNPIMIGQDYFYDSGFFTIWNRAKENKGWFDFTWRMTIERKKVGHQKIDALLNYLISPQVFPYEWAKWLGWDGRRNE